ncbi:hypothetical protein AQUCO_04700063v1 [Aquilegia coerulea]|uniref:FBD domain-containing protein n=1 Tax=Aquilegia coerulea TaxID=218851 RepID=A0A2G5CL79_AQUCA|nr:hypothetical protein AQUCO_04700063v1 [Aquilegia coerulea]
MCTPNLLSLYCEGEPYADYFLENLPSLDSAYIGLDVGLKKDAERFCKILKGLYNMTCSTLSDGWVEVFSKYSSVLRQLSNPFHKLRHLKLPNCRRYCSNAVSNLLGLSPHIETLVWEITEENSIPVAGGDLPLNCVLCDLKDVEVHNLEGCEDELKLLEFIMKNAVVLKRISITTTKALSSARERELIEFSNKLQCLSRASSNLNIFFLLKSVTSLGTEAD